MELHELVEKAKAQWGIVVNASYGRHSYVWHKSQEELTKEEIALFKGTWKDGPFEALPDHSKYEDTYVEELWYLKDD